MERLLSIGDVSRRAGVAPSALRFYEAEGLICSERTAGNQRRYRRDVLRRVAVVQVAQAAGLRLSEVQALLSTLPTDRVPNRDDWCCVQRSLEPLLDREIRELTALREQLTDVAAWDRPDDR